MASQLQPHVIPSLPSSCDTNPNFQSVLSSPGLTLTIDTREHSRLDELPVEILERIASLGPCQSALTLLKVNRTIHRACNDSQVFRNILSDNAEPPWNTIPLPAEAPASSWARYALADSLGRHWPTESQAKILAAGHGQRLDGQKADGYKGVLVRTCQWASQLMAAGRQ